MQVYEIIFNKVIDLIDQGHLIWQQGWIKDQINYYQKRKYTGFNALYLNLIAQSRQYKLPYWLTFTEIQKLGGSVKKGEKSIPVIFYKPVFKCEDCNHQENGNCELHNRIHSCRDYTGVPYFMMRYYNVWNSDQTCSINYDDDLHENVSLNPLSLIKAENTALNYICNESIEFKIGGTRASYAPSTDTINLPVRETFDNMDRYYSVLFHEICHSTGHPNRLARKIMTESEGIVFGSEDYSMEEIIAEMGSLFLCSKTGITRKDNIKNSAAYIANWKEYLTSNKKAIFIAANLAEKATDFILQKADVKNVA